MRRRLGFQGEIRATGDVLIDQLVSMARTGFDVAVLREGLDADAAQRQFDRFPDFYQGSAVETKPLLQSIRHECVIHYFARKTQHKLC